MSLTEFAKDRLRDFFMITALVNIVMYVLGSIYMKGNVLEYSALLQPPLYGFFGTLPSWIMYSKRELPMKQYLIRKIISVLILEILLILVTFPGDYMNPGNAGMILSFAVSVLIVYLLVAGISWLLDKKSADAMMKELEMFQRSVSPDGEFPEAEEE